MRRWLALGLGLGVVGLGVVGVEGWLRGQEKGFLMPFMDPPAIKLSLNPDHADTTRGWHAGLQAPDPLPAKKQVAFIGDSLTYGLFVREDQALPAQVAGLMSGAQARFFNLGVPAWDASEVAAFTESKLEAWAPDVVVWTTYVNDPFPTYIYYDSASKRPIFVGTHVPPSATLLPEPFALFLVQQSAIFRLLQGAAFARFADSRETMEPSPDWYDIQFERIYSWCQSHQAALLVVVLPPHILSDPVGCPGRSPDPGKCAADAAIYRRILAVAQAHPIPVVDGLAVWQGSGASDFYSSQRDPDHPSAAGYTWIAKALQPLLAPLLPQGEASPNAWRRHPPRP